MTIISIILVYLLLLSLHACHARHLTVTEFNGVSLSKDENEMRLYKSIIPLKVKASLSKELSKQQKRVKIKVTRGRASTKKLINGSTGNLLKNSIDQDANGNISAKLSRKRHNRHPDPAFSLDYAPPLTHPPSHN